MPERSQKLELYLSHRQALVEYASPIVGCRAKAEDVVQEAWLRFNEASTDRIPLPQPVGYLYRIVRNLAFDLNRRLTLENRHPASEDELQGLPSENPSPECEALYSDELQQVENALARLPERSRQAFVMHRLHGMTFKDIALRLGISTSLAHQLVRDALTFCSEHLSDD
ncbi:sigma-70 family RNA polymerase sigma factor [Pseudomonas sp. Marseille-P9899]|uniref:sigma-70 family RNA polymerase sigma factor n=1 Tax=Pseudomonas sp. Marseille-P9899 TaxID=2730401 RepID=UPI00158D95BA|nr:sigma-70 family RNA polymerase sigma factor [Pseudomonas sp. Marseille-P9899]